MTSPRDLLAAGARLGPYELKGLLGAGGMGSVYRAFDTRLHREVAVKVLPTSLADDPDLLKRFHQESRVLAALSHSNVLGVFDVGESDGRHYLVTELLEGETLDENLARPQRSLSHSLDTAVQLARGLAAVHERGVIHRDLKPSNVFLTRDGQVKLIDFGLARTEGGDNLTRSGSFMGTPGYMGPEQLKGLPLDARADQFAFGAVLYEVLTGQRAFDGTAPMERALAAMTKEPPELASLCEGPQGALFQVARRCLEKAPERRFASMTEVLAALTAQREALGSASQGAGLEASHGRPLFTPAPSGSHDTVISKNEAPPRPKGLTRFTAGRWALLSVAVLVLSAIVALVVRPGGPRGGTSAAHRGGVLRIAAVEGVSSFNLSATIITLNRWAMLIMLEPLTRIGAQGSIEPVVLEKWTVSEDRRTVELTLRPNLRFHDHPCFKDGLGRVADGEDLVYSLAQALKGGQLELVMAPAGVQATPRGAVLHLEQPDAFVDTKLTQVSLIPRELEGCEDLHNLKRPVGTGPFFLAEPPDSQSIHLSRFPGYWRTGADGQPLPYLDGVVLHQVMTPANALTQIAAGDADLIFIGVDAMGQVLEPALPLRLRERFASPALKVAGLSTEGHPALLGVMVFNPKTGALATPALRRAASLALDRPALAAIEQTLVPSSRFLLPFSLGRNPSIPEDLHDLKEARRLVTAAGPLPPIKLGLVHEHMRFGEPVKAQLERAGFKVQLLPLDRAGAEVAVANHTIDASVMYWLSAMRGPEPYPYVRIFRGIEHAYGFESAPLDTLITGLTAEPDIRLRAGLYAKIETQLLSDVPMIPIGYLKPDAAPLVAIFGPGLRGHLDATGQRLLQPGYAPALAEVWLAPAPR